MSKITEQMEKSLKDFEEKEENLSNAILTMLKGLSYFEIRKILITVKDKAELNTKLS